MKKSVLILMLAALLATSAMAGGTKGTWTGKIGDEKCGAKVDADCAQKCMDAGHKPVFVTDDEGKVIPIANPEKVAGHAGHHVKVTGTMDKDVLTITEIAMVEEPKSEMK
jgi:hypothetical protein